MLLANFRFVILCWVLLTLENLQAQAETQIKEDPSISIMRAKRKEYRESADYSFEGYRIFVNIFSNRKEATKFQKQFNQRFVDKASCQIIYDEPNFKIYAGTYILKAEAEIMLGRVRQAYPTAKIIRMPVPFDVTAFKK